MGGLGLKLPKSTVDVIVKCKFVSPYSQSTSKVLFQDTVTQTEDTGIVFINLPRQFFIDNDKRIARFHVDIKGPGAVSYRETYERTRYEKTVVGRNKEGRITGDVTITPEGFSGQIEEFYFY